MKIIVTISFIFAIFPLFSQKLVYKPPTTLNVIEMPNGGIMTQGLIIEGDTFIHIKLSPIYIFPERKFKNNREKRRYDKLVYNLKVVYPYAVLVGNIYQQIDYELKNIQSERERKEYIKMKEKELFAKYEKELVELTITQGKLLVKLVDRQTSHSTYEILKNYKGSLNAVFWQAIGSIFGYDLKVKYHAEDEDKYIEEIIAKIENGQI